MSQMKAIYSSMTVAERKNVDLLDAGRRRRIARGAGLDLNVIGQFVKQFEMMRDTRFYHSARPQRVGDDAAYRLGIQAQRGAGQAAGRGVRAAEGKTRTPVASRPGRRGGRVHRPPRGLLRWNALSHQPLHQLKELVLG